MRYATIITMHMFVWGQQIAIAGPVGSLITPTTGDGWSTTVDINGNNIDINDPRIRGSNAYHSFEEFGVQYFGPGDFETVNFTVPNASNNLINVVRASHSQIDGIVNAFKGGSIGGNVFFVNPHGDRKSVV